MKYDNTLKSITGKAVKEWHGWLKRNQCGCCSVCFASDDEHDYVVCMGWHYAGPERIAQEDGTFRDVPGDDGWRIAWKVGRQSVRSIMQSDFDIDFEMPYDEETGAVDDTIETVENGEAMKAKDWNSLATSMRKTARRVRKDWVKKPSKA